MRISFLGGGTDIAPYDAESGGNVLSIAINKYAYTDLEFLSDKKIVLESEGNILEFNKLSDIVYDGNLDILKSVVRHFNASGIRISLSTDIGKRSGLGLSASVYAALIGLFNLGGDLTKHEIAETAYKLEREDLKNMGGRQDQYAAVFGGMNFIEFRGGDFVKVERLNIKEDYLKDLERNLIMVKVGERGDSGEVIEDQTRSYKERKKRTLEGLDEAKKMAIEGRKYFIRGDLIEFGNLLNDAWEAKKKFSDKITNPTIDKIYNLGMKNGALGGKISGAGGGGHMFFYSHPEKTDKLKRALKNTGLTVIDFGFDFNGLVTWKTKTK